MHGTCGVCMYVCVCVSVRVCVCANVHIISLGIAWTHWDLRICPGFLIMEVKLYSKVLVWDLNECP